MRCQKIAFLLMLICTPSVAETITYDQAKSSGFKECLPFVKNLTEFLHGGVAHGAHSMLPRKNPDSQMFSSTIERNYSDGTEIQSIFVAPIPSGACTGAYERIMWQDKSCATLAKEVFPGFENKGKLNKFVTYLTKKTGGVVYLLTAGSGCLVIRKEINIVPDKNS